MTQAPIDTMNGEFKRAARVSQSSVDAGSATTTFSGDPDAQRRSELARAGISPSWYTSLEQGREINPSPEVLGQLADALLLSASERAHLNGCRDVLTWNEAT